MVTFLLVKCHKLTLCNNHKFVFRTGKLMDVDMPMEWDKVDFIKLRNLWILYLSKVSEKILLPHLLDYV